MLSPTALVLVAVMNNARDLEIARMLGWYRIPLRSAPKIIDVDYLAFYQTTAFKNEGRQIRYIAAVRGHELATRAELLRDELDHPHAMQEYYKVQIGPLECLEKPIPAGEWHRITFFYTTGEYLNFANTTDDLIIQSDQRPILWKNLRERSVTSQEPGIDQDIDLDPAVIAALLGFPTDLNP